MSSTSPSCEYADARMPDRILLMLYSDARLVARRAARAARTADRGPRPDRTGHSSQGCDSHGATCVQVTSTRRGCALKNVTTTHSARPLGLGYRHTRRSTRTGIRTRCAFVLAPRSVRSCLGARARASRPTEAAPRAMARGAVAAMATAALVAVVAAAVGWGRTFGRRTRDPH